MGAKTTTLLPVWPRDAKWLDTPELGRNGCFKGDDFTYLVFTISAMVPKALFHCVDYLGKILNFLLNRNAS